ncbi:MAG: glycosyltransferase family 4 protein [Thermoplasmataceae archaeon]
MKILIISPRLIKSDMRGGEEVIRTIFKGIRLKIDTFIFTSDALDIKYQHSIFYKSLRNNVNEKIIDRQVFYLTSLPLINMISKGLSKLLKVIYGSKRSNFSNRLLNKLEIISHGPFLFLLKYKIKKLKPDLIWGSIFPTEPSFSALKVALKYKIPFVYTPYYHYKIKSFSDNIFLETIVKKSSAVIACTENEKNELIKLGATDINTYVIPLGIEIKQRPDNKDIEIFKKSLKIENMFVILAQAWIDKGISDIIKSVAELSKHHRDVVLVTIGNPDYEYTMLRDEFKSRCYNLKIIDLGWVSGPLKWLVFSMADVFIMLSNSDAFGLSYLDSFAMKVPIIAMSNTSAQEIITNSVDGYLLESGNLNQITNKIEELYSNRDLCKELGFNGFDKLQKKFTSEKMIENYENLFLKIISDK